MAKKKDDKEIEQITKSCRCALDGDSIKRMDMGEITLTAPHPGPTPDNFADAAFRQNAGSLRKLMVPYYRVVVITPEREYSYGLDRWIKLMGGSKDEAERMGDRKQRVRRGNLAA